MELLNRLTIKNLKLNKKRTIVTIIGIILATALITGVATLVSSFRESIIVSEKQQSGNYHYSFSNVPTDEIKYIQNNRNVESSYVIQDIGYSMLEGSKNEEKPYLYVRAFDKEALNNSGIELIEGRFPENENEIIISKHIQTNAGVKYNIGDEITLDIGKRMLDGYELDETNAYNEYYDDEGKRLGESSNEELVIEKTQTYKIVGVIERPSFTLENYGVPGYTVITLLEQPYANKKTTVYALYKDINKEYETTANIIGVDVQEFEKFITSRPSSMEDIDKFVNNVKYDWNRNDSLLRWQKLEFSDSNTTMLFTVSAVVIVIIMVTSVFCIRKSFAISITEKIRQYGMLASVGATPKQIKKNVLYEGLILGLIGIPIGILSGLGAIFILLKVVEKILIEGVGLEFDLVYKTSVIAILVSIFLSAITIYLSAKKSAKKAAKISPIEAIRSNQDIQVKGKKLKTPKVIKKVFGIGGEIAYKNLKRNNKKYRTTVISIVVSVAIFIAMTSFMGYAFETSSIYYTDYNYNFSIGTTNIDNDYYTFKKISENEQVKSFSISRTMLLKLDVNQLLPHYSDETNAYLSEYDEVNDNIEMQIFALGKEEYDRYIKELGLKYDDVKDKAILIDNMVEYTTIDGKSSYKMYRVYDYNKGDKISGTLNDDIPLTLEIATATDVRPMGKSNFYTHAGFLVVSDEFMDQYKENIEPEAEIFVDAEDADVLQQFIEENYLTEDGNSLEGLQNIDSYVKQDKAMWLIISIFLYGFITVISLIGVTNIFNTITTNMELRQKEFANLKSIGMTKKEFNKMIRLESIFYGTKSLVIGIPIGLVLSYFLYKAFGINAEMDYIIPVNGILISILVVAILVGVIMRYSLNKINKQNIIETIRKDNI